MKNDNAAVWVAVVVCLGAGAAIVGWCNAERKLQERTAELNQVLDIRQRTQLELDVIRRELLDEKTSRPHLLPAEDRFLPDLK